jgi:hypothetical protein
MKKILGLILLFIGLATEIFKTAESKSVLPVENQEIQDQLQKLVQDQLKGMLPANSIPQLLNLISWSILATILIFGGGQIASLGIKLLA